jgi:hypothetical protein
MAYQEDQFDEIPLLRPIHLTPYLAITGCYIQGQPMDAARYFDDLAYDNYDNHLFILSANSKC